MSETTTGYDAEAPLLTSLDSEDYNGPWDFTINGVDMVCTFCRMPVVRGGPGWVHLTASGSSRCRRLEADVTAMAAAGNENVPADEHLEDLNTCPEAYRWEAD